MAGIEDLFGGEDFIFGNQESTFGGGESTPGARAATPDELASPSDTPTERPTEVTSPDTPPVDIVSFDSYTDGDYSDEAYNMYVGSYLPEILAYKNVPKDQADKLIADWKKNNPLPEADAKQASIPAQSIGGALSDFAVGVGKGANAAIVGVVRLGEMLQAVQNPFNTASYLQGGNQELSKLLDASKEADALYSDTVQAQKERLSKTEGFVNSFGVVVQSPSLLAAVVTESVPQLVGGMAAAGRVATTRALASLTAQMGGTPAAAKAAADIIAKRATLAAASFEGAMTGANANAEIQSALDAAGIKDPVDRGKWMAIGLPLGVVTAAIGRFSPLEANLVVNHMLSKGLGKEAIEEAVQRTAPQVLINAAKAGAVGAIKEGTEEVLQQSAETVTVNLATAFDSKQTGLYNIATEGLGRNNALAAAAGIVTGGALGGATGIQNTRRVETAIEDAVGAATEGATPNVVTPEVETPTPITPEAEVSIVSPTAEPVPITPEASVTPEVATPISPEAAVTPEEPIKTAQEIQAEENAVLPDFFEDDRKPQPTVSAVAPSFPSDLPRISLTPALPSNLRGAKPRYKTTTLSFASDLDKAAYIIADENKKSKSDAEYVAYVQSIYPNLTPAQLRETGRRVRAAASQSPDGKVAEVLKAPAPVFSSDVDEAMFVLGTARADGFTKSNTKYLDWVNSQIPGIETPDILQEAEKYRAQVLRTGRAAPLYEDLMTRYLSPVQTEVLQRELRSEINARPQAAAIYAASDRASSSALKARPTRPIGSSAPIQPAVPEGGNRLTGYARRRAQGVPLTPEQLEQVGSLRRVLRAAPTPDVANPEGASGIVGNITDETTNSSGGPKVALELLNGIQGTPLERRVLDALKKGDVPNALRWMGVDSALPVTIRAAAQHFSTKMGNPPSVKIKRLPKDVKGLYYPASNQIVLSKDIGLDAHTFLHEVAHALTASVIADPNKTADQVAAIAELKLLYDAAKLALPEEYASTNLDEFIAEAYSNRDFQLKLHTSAVPTSKNISLWNKFVNLVSRLLTLPSALADTLTFAEALISANPNTPAQAAKVDSRIPFTIDRTSPFYTAVLSRVAPYTNISRQLAQQGAVITGEQSTYEIGQLANSRAQAMEESQIANWEAVTALTAAYGKRFGASWLTLNDDLVNLRVVGFALEMQSKYPAVRKDGSSGVDLLLKARQAQAKADAALQALPKSQRDALIGIAKSLKRITDAHLDWQVIGGVYTPQRAATLQRSGASKYMPGGFYVPLQADINLDNNVQVKKESQGVQFIGEDVIARINAQGAKIATSVQRNAQIKALGAIAQVYNVKYKGMADSIIEPGEVFTLQFDDQTGLLSDRLKPVEGDTLTYYENGQGFKLRLVNADISNVFAPVLPDYVQRVLAWTKLIRGYTAMFSVAKSGLSPLVFLTQHFKDVLAPLANLPTDVKVAAVYAALPLNYVRAAQGNLADISSGASAFAKAVGSKKYTVVKNNGAFIAHRAFVDLEESSKDFERDFSPSFLKSTLANLRNPSGTKVFKIALLATKTLDDAIRMSVYDAAIASGKSASQASVIAKNTTLNFEEKGGVSQIFTPFIPFSNVVLAAARQTYDNTFGYSRNPRTIAMFGMMAVLGAVAAGLLLEEEDEFGTAKLITLPESKRNNLLLLGKNASWYGIPITEQMSPAFALGQAMAEVYSGDTSPTDAAIRVTKAAMAAYTPGNRVGDPFENLGHYMVSSAIPPLLKPEIQIGFNKNDFGGLVNNELAAVRGGKTTGVDKADTSFKSDTTLNKEAARYVRDKVGVDIYPGSLALYTDLITFGLPQQMGALLPNSAKKEIADLLPDDMAKVYKELELADYVGVRKPGPDNLNSYQKKISAQTAEGYERRQLNSILLALQKNRNDAYRSVNISSDAVGSVDLGGTYDGRLLKDYLASANTPKKTMDGIKLFDEIYATLARSSKEKEVDPQVLNEKYKPAYQALIKKYNDYKRSAS